LALQQKKNNTYTHTHARTPQHHKYIYKDAKAKDAKGASNL